MVSVPKSIYMLSDTCDGLNMVGPENSTIRRCGLVGIGVASLE